MSARSSRFALFAFAACAPLFGPPAFGGYPDRIIRIVVPFAPGGGTDVVARTLAQEMAKDLGASIIIENKPGAGTIIGTQMVATSPPDGYTLLMGTFANAVNPSLKRSCPMTPTRISPRWRCWRAPSISSWSIPRPRSNRLRT
jgi:tripartite-type tricarboxylate transporter receptor subunit TctC